MESFLGLFKRKKEEEKPASGGKPCQARDCIFYALPEHPELLCSYCAKKAATGLFIHFKDPALELQQQESLLVKRENEIAVVKQELENYYEKLMNNNNGSAIATQNNTNPASTTAKTTSHGANDCDLSDLNPCLVKKKSSKKLLKKEKKEKERAQSTTPREMNPNAFDVNLFAVRFDDARVPYYVREVGGEVFFNEYLEAPPVPTLSKLSTADYRYRQERKVSAIPFIVEFRNPNATSIYMRFDYNANFDTVYRYLATRVQCNPGLLELFFAGKLIMRARQTQFYNNDVLSVDNEYEETEPDTPPSPEASRCLARGDVIRSTDAVRDLLNCLIVNVIHVRDVPPPSARTIAFFARVNRRINRVHIDRHGDESITCSGLALNSDILLRIVRHLSWEDALELSMVSVYWYLTIVRYFLLIQLDINCAFKVDQPYPFVLNTWINEYTFQLARSSPSKPSQFDHLWDEINPTKFYFSGHSMKTIYYSVLEDNMYGNMLGQTYLRSMRHEFFTLFKPMEFPVVDFNGNYLILNERPFAAETDYVYDEAQQARPVLGGAGGFVAEAIVPFYLNAAISLICNYFSPNMKYFIPLMAYKVLFVWDVFRFFFACDIVVGGGVVGGIVVVIIIGVVVVVVVFCCCCCYYYYYYFVILLVIYFILFIFAFIFHLSLTLRRTSTASTSPRATRLSCSRPSLSTSPTWRL
jgi:hypothetical protein